MSDINISDVKITFGGTELTEVDGKWHDIPDKFYGKLMDEATIDQIMIELKIS